MSLGTRTWVFVLMAVLFCTAATSTPIPLNSGDDLSGLTEWNNLAGPNVLINPHPLWQPNGAGKWISYALTGDGQYYPPNNWNAPLAVFYEIFTLPAPSIAGSITVWADDTAGVYLDNMLLWPPSLTQDNACAIGPIACLPDEGGTFSLAGLPAAVHTLRFEAYQLGGYPFGILYEGWVEPVPEPLTFMLIGAGLAALGLLRRRSRT